MKGVRPYTGCPVCGETGPKATSGYLVAAGEIRWFPGGSDPERVLVKSPVGDVGLFVQYCRTCGWMAFYCPEQALSPLETRKRADFLRHVNFASGQPSYRQVVGVVDYLDLGIDRQSQLRVSAFPPTGKVAVFVDWNVEHQGDVGDDFEIAFDQPRALELVAQINHAVSRGKSGGNEWEVVGSVRYAWSDQDDSIEAPNGAVAIELRRGQARLVVRFDARSNRSEGIATFDMEVARGLSRLLEQALTLAKS